MKKYHKGAEPIPWKHGHNRRNYQSPTYYSWRGMKKRCLSPRHPHYHNYGGRGITICRRWIHSFSNFLQDMGERPKGRTLDRINTNRNYTPSNCRWATWKQQAANKRNRKSHP
jgi:hypothetical protein